MKKIPFGIFLMLLAAVLSSCGDESAARVDETAGAGRYEVPETMESEKGDIPVNPTETDDKPADPSETTDDDPAETDGRTTQSPATEISWRIENGKYVYTFPERDDSGLANVAEMETFTRARFDDQPNDWFIGKTLRDEATGEVTYVWDRSQQTLDAIAKYGAVYRGDEERKVVYLTFDCGYEYGTTAEILDVLKEKNVPATFFVNGWYVESAPHMVRRMLDDGHIIGNHCDNHEDMTTVSVDTFIKEVQGLEDIYYATFPDAPPMLYFRPPSGNCSEWVLKFADMMGYTTVMWSWAYYDFDVNNQMSVSNAMAKVKAGLHNGCVYLLHTESTTNAAMLGEMIDWIRGEGYEFLPLADIDAK